MASRINPVPFYFAKKVNPKNPNIDSLAVNELLLRVEKLAIKRHVYYRIVSYEALNRRISF